MMFLCGGDNVAVVYSGGAFLRTFLRRRRGGDLAREARNTAEREGWQRKHRMRQKGGLLRVWGTVRAESPGWFELFEGFKG